MRRGLLACTVIAALGAASAGAAGYDDFTRGLTANLRDDYPTAVTAFTAALAAPDLVAVYRPVALRGRAAAYLELDRCEDALADIKAYAEIKPDDPKMVGQRLWANLCRKDAAAARKDLDALTKDKPGAYELWWFSRLEWRYGLFAEAAAMSEQAFATADKKEGFAPYLLLWQALSATRAGQLDQAVLAASQQQLSRRSWPRPILEFYLGKMSWESLMKEASSWSKARGTAQTCEANFYVAEWHLGRNDSAAATPLLLAVMDNCPIDFIERSAAQTELKRMGVKVPEDVE